MPTLYNKKRICRIRLVNFMRVRGAYMTIKEFLYTYKKGIVYTDRGTIEHDTWDLAADRRLIIPDYQREYRWEGKQLSELVDDISNGNCYLGQIAVSHNIGEPKDYFLVDGQQRITSIIILLTILCRYFFLAQDTNNFKNFELHLRESNTDNPQRARLSFEANCFQGFQTFISQIYKLDTTDDDGSFDNSKISPPQKDSYRQAERYIDACSIFNRLIEKQLISKRTRPDKMKHVKEIIQKILDTQISVVIFEGNSSYESEKIFLDINEKGLRLDNEDILKAYYFQSATDGNGQDVLVSWTQLKESFFDFQTSLHSNKTPLETFVNYTLQTELFMKEDSWNYLKFDDELRYKDQYGKKHICQLLTDTDLYRSIVWTSAFFKDIRALLEMDAHSPFYAEYFDNHDSTTREVFKFLFKSVCLSDMKIIYIALIKLWWLRRYRCEKITLEDIIQLFSFYIISNISGLKKERQLFNNKFITAKLIEESYQYLHIIEIQMLKDAFSKGTALKQDQEKAEFLSFNIQMFYNDFRFNCSKKQWEISISNQEFLAKYSAHRKKYVKDHFLIQNGKTIRLINGEDFTITRSMMTLRKRAYNFIYHEDNFGNKDFMTRLELIFSGNNGLPQQYGKYEQAYFQFIKEQVQAFFKENNMLPTWERCLEKYRLDLPHVFPLLISHILVENSAIWNNQICKFFEHQFSDELKEMVER